MFKGIDRRRHRFNNMGENGIFYKPICKKALDGGLKIMSTYDSTVSLMRDMTESDLLKIREFVIRLSTKSEVRKEMYNPYKPLTREEIIEQLAEARKHADEGRVMEAHQASQNVRAKYGL